MAFPVSIIMEQFPKFSLPFSQHAWRRSKLVPIGTVSSVMRSIRPMGNDFHVSHVEIDLIVLEIWLVVDSSSCPRFNRDDLVFTSSVDPKLDSCVIENR
jgi:hypothetical protein